jgi:hypothetical protein
MGLLAHQSGHEDARGTRTLACRVHTRVNAFSRPQFVFARVRTRHARVRALRCGAARVDGLI